MLLGFKDGKLLFKDGKLCEGCCGEDIPCGPDCHCWPSGKAPEFIRATISGITQCPAELMFNTPDCPSPPYGSCAPANFGGAMNGNYILERTPYSGACYYGWEGMGHTHIGVEFFYDGWTRVQVVNEEGHTTFYAIIATNCASSISNQNCCIEAYRSSGGSCVCACREGVDGTAGFFSGGSVILNMSECNV